MVNKMLNWITSQQKVMVDRLQTWSDINSGSENLSGLSKMLTTLESEFKGLDGILTQIKLPSRSTIGLLGESIEVMTGDALHLVKRQDSPIKVLLCGHMDTVYPANSPFQNARITEHNRMVGPGVADMKGGLVVMLTALEAFEQHPLAKHLGWEVLITPDEETGSLSSEKLLIESAKRSHFGLVFEPTLPDGAIVSMRKGSANFTVVVRGRASHAGRNPENGRSAIVAISNFIIKLELLIENDITINVGQIFGGETVNTVPDLAICRLNIRASKLEQFQTVIDKVYKLANLCQSDGITLTIHQHHMRLPKPFENAGKLIKRFNLCAEQEGVHIEHRSSGGVCDGNTLAAASLETLDTMGVVGGDLHSPKEYVLLDSLAARARLTFRFLINTIEEVL